MTSESIIKTWNIAIIGSRTFNNYDKFKYYLNDYFDKNDNIKKYRIISGGAIGTDSMASRYARENKIEILEMLPNWKKHGRKAGIIRNTDIINSADLVIAFSQNNSSGTNDSIKKAKAAGKVLSIIYV